MPEQLKNRVLIILEILWTQTDEQHPITIRQIQEQLYNSNVAVGRKTVADDIIALQNAGYDIICNKRQQNQYFIGTRDFEMPELAVLIDAVQAVRFIGPRKRKQLISKLTKQASQHQAVELQKRSKPALPNQGYNQSIYYMIEDLRMAITQKNKLLFQYFEYTPQKQRVLKHGGYQYSFSPYDLMWSGDLYYVIGYSERHEKVATFRVDRMTNLIPLDEQAIPYPPDYHIDEYRNRIFQMYEGITYKVVLRCDNSLMDAVIDRFGIDCHSQVDGDKCFLLTAKIATSPTFFAWLFNFVGKVEVISPYEVVSEYQARLQTALKLSQGGSVDE